MAHNAKPATIPPPDSAAAETLSLAREVYEARSTKASDVARQIAFAGIGVIWIYKTGDGAAARVAPEFHGVLVLLCVALLCDVLHYVSAALVWGIYGRWLERNLQRRTVTATAFNEPDGVPRSLNWPGNFFFVSKLAATTWASAWLALILWAKWNPPVVPHP